MTEQTTRSAGGATPEAEAQRRRHDLAAVMTGAGTVPGVHSVVWVRGTDAVTFLDGLLSQNIGRGEPGTVDRSLLLTPQGKLRALLWILHGDTARESQEVGLVTQRPAAELVVEDLSRFRFRVDAAIEIEPRPTITLIGPQARARLRAGGLSDPGRGWRYNGNGLVAATPFTGGAPERYVLVGAPAAAVTEVAGPVGFEAYESVRIAAGEPLATVDFDDRTIAQELGPVDDAVDFDKGCYLGQELVARIASRGRVTRRLRAVRAAGDAPLRGARLSTRERDVGVVTSAATAPDGATIGLALIRHEVEAGTVVTAHSATGPLQAEVLAVPLLRR